MGISLNQQYDIIAKVNSNVYSRSITVLKQHSCVLERIIHMRRLHLHWHTEDSNGPLQPLLLLLLLQTILQDSLWEAHKHDFLWCRVLHTM